MPNLEQPKTLETIPSPAEAKEILASYKKLGDKMVQVDSYLRAIENKLQNDTKLRKDEKAELEQVFNEIESQKKIIAASMDTPAARVEAIDDKLRSLEIKMESGEFRKDEKEVFNEEFNTLEAKKKALLDQAQQTPAVPINPTAAPIVQVPAQPSVAQPKAAPSIQQLVQAVAATKGPANPVINPVIVNQPAQNINNAPSVPVAPTIPTRPTGPTGPTGPIAPVTAAPTKTPEQLLAEKIRNEEPLTREDLLLRRERFYGPGGVEEEIMKLAEAKKVANPPVEEVHNFIEHGGPDLERARNDYVLALFQNRNSYYPDVATFAQLKNLKETYNKKVEEGVQAIQPVGDMLEDQIACKKLRLKFLQGEREAFQREVLRLESKETRERIGKAIDRAIDKTGKFLGKAKEKIGQGMDRIGKFFEDDPNTKGMGWIYYLVASQGAPLMAGAWGEKPIGEAVDNGINTLRRKFKEALSSKTPKTESPEAKKTLAEKFGGKNNPEQKEKTPEEVEAERKKAEIETRKKAFLEKALGVELKGETLNEWVLLSNVSTGKFFTPSKFKTAKTLDDYPPLWRKIHDALRPAYTEAEKTSKIDRTKDIKGTNKLSLKEFINKLAEQDKLKDLWTTTSNNNS